MATITWPVLTWLFFKVIQTEASSWTNEVPSLVKGFLGSCVVIPCTFNYPDPQRTPSKLTGIWLDGTSHAIYHPINSKILQQYRDRTELLGDVTQKNCSLKIDPLQRNDGGPFHFRIEIAGYENYSFKEKIVSISTIDKPNVALSVKKDMTAGQTTVASCSVSPSCPTSPPVFEWSHSGEARLQSQQFIDGQWKTTATLNFLPSHTDHNKPLLCTVRFKGGGGFETSSVLKVKHAPVDVKVQYKSEVKEGEAVSLKCSSDAFPPASSYEWHLENGTLLHRGNMYTLSNVSRHIGAIYCTAINTKGRSTSSLVQLNVLYAPEIKNVSACSSEKDKVTCICIVESKPPCMIHFVLMGRVLSGTTVQRHGSVTIGTHLGEFGSSEFVHCLANNTEGYANHTLSLPVNGKMEYLYIAITIGAVVVLVIILVAVGLVQKGRRKTGDMPTHHSSPMAANKAEELPQYAVAKGKEMEMDDNVQSPGYYDNDHVYSNVETDLDEAVYANM